jgi:hypothetical protein
MMKKNLEILNELRMLSPTLYELKDGGSDSALDTENVNESYFENLQDMVLTQYRIETITAGKDAIPAGYFKDLQTAVLDNVAPKQVFNIRSLLKYASVVVLIAVSAIIVTKSFIQSENTDQNLISFIDESSDEEIMMVLDGYTTNRNNFNLMVDQGIVDVSSPNSNAEEMQILDYLDVSENELLESYKIIK